MAEEMKTLGNLKPAKGSARKKKRLGRGIGSQWGKTSGKGMKGQKARKGGGVAPGFEGGQMPLYRRLPKRGFKNFFRKNFAAINLDILNELKTSEKITPDFLKQNGLISKGADYVKLLGRGKLEKGLTIAVHKASKSAQEAVSGAGGQLELIEIKTRKKAKRNRKSKKKK